jgi:hypothetical protein
MRRKICLFSILGLLFLSFSGSAFAQSDEKEMMKVILESFCQDYYGSCFSGRTYMEHSLTVDRLEIASLNEVKIYGFHSYKGRYGATYTYMEYIAYVTIRSSSIKIEFNKKSKADFFHDEDYWEKCTKTIYTD